MEITQIGSHQSDCTLQSVFLDKPENYTLQLERLIVDITPNINLIQGPYFSVLRRPSYQNASGGDYDGFFDVDDMPDLVFRYFTPVAPKSILDVFTQLNAFCALHDGLDVTISQDYKISFRLTQVWGDSHYLKLNPVFAELIQLPEYIYFFRRHNRIDNPEFTDGDDIETVVSVLVEYGNDYIQNNRLFYVDADTDEDFHIDNQMLLAMDPFFAQSAEPELNVVASIESLDTLKSLDTRLSYEVNCTLPSDSKLDILGRDPSLKRITARFPIRDTIQEYNTFHTYGFELSEVINVGIEDVCRKNPNTQTLNLHQGEVRLIRTDIFVRYLESKKITLVPADFGDTGFFSLMLLFTKRIK